MFGSSVIGRGVESCLRAGGGRLVTEEVWMAFFYIYIYIYIYFYKKLWMAFFIYIYIFL